MKICLYSFPNLAHGGGFERYLISLGRELSNRGFDVSIVTINRAWQYKFEFVLSVLYLRPRLRFPEKFRLSIKEIHENIGKSKLFEVKSLREMKKYLNYVDVIYSKNEILDLIVLNFLKDRSTPPIITGLHTALYYPIVNSVYSRIHNTAYSSRLYSRLLRMCSAIHTVNTYQREFLIKTHKLEPDRIYYIPLWIDIDDRVLKEVYKGVPSSSNHFNILFVGRLTEQKGIDTLCRIINKVNKIESVANKIVFHIVGSGELSREIKKLSKKYSNVKYYGYVSQGDLKRLYQVSNLVIVPSKWETVSYVCLEAQSFGIPVVASNIPGPKDIIIHGKTGYLIEPTNINCFVNAVLDVYEHRNTKEYVRMRIEAVRNICKRFSKEVIIPKMIAMFRKIASQT